MEQQQAFADDMQRSTEALLAQLKDMGGAEVGCTGSTMPYAHFCWVSLAYPIATVHDTGHHNSHGSTLVVVWFGGRGDSGEALGPHKLSLPGAPCMATLPQ